MLKYYQYLLYTYISFSYLDNITQLLQIDALFRYAHPFHLNNNTYLTCNAFFAFYSIEITEYKKPNIFLNMSFSHTFNETHFLSLSLLHSYFNSLILSQFYILKCKNTISNFLKICFSNCVPVSFSRDLFRRQSLNKGSWNVKPQSQQTQKFRI